MYIANVAFTVIIHCILLSIDAFVLVPLFIYLIPSGSNPPTPSLATFPTHTCHISLLLLLLSSFPHHFYIVSSFYVLGGALLVSSLSESAANHSRQGFSLLKFTF
jgi:hypothetical protein